MNGKKQKQSLNVGLGIAMGVAIGMFMDNIAMGIGIAFSLVKSGDGDSQADRSWFDPSTRSGQAELITNVGFAPVLQVRSP